MRALLLLAIVTLVGCGGDSPLEPKPCEPEMTTPLLDAAGDSASVVLIGFCLPGE